MKYHKYIAKYNLSRLFVVQDVIPDHGDDHSAVYQGEIKQFLKQIGMTKYYKAMKDYGIDDMDELEDFTEQDLEKKLDIDDSDDRKEIFQELHKLKSTNMQIRHLRKFAGTVLLGPLDILRNLNIIRDQLQSLFKSPERERTREEEQKESNEEKEDSWKEWKASINKNNRDLWKQLRENNREDLLKLNESSSFLKLTDEQKQVVSSLLTSILRTIIKRSRRKRTQRKI